LVALDTECDVVSENNGVEIAAFPISTKHKQTLTEEAFSSRRHHNDRDSWSEIFCCTMKELWFVVRPRKRNLPMGLAYIDMWADNDVLHDAFEDFLVHIVTPAHYRDFTFSWEVEGFLGMCYELSIQVNASLLGEGRIRELQVKALSCRCPNIRLEYRIAPSSIALDPETNSGPTHNDNQVTTLSCSAEQDRIPTQVSRRVNHQTDRNLRPHVVHPLN
jgi:hypothetical protein